MKKALSILLVLLMVCSTVVAMIPAHAEGTTDWEAVTDAMGANIYIGGEIATAPVLDGVISDGEYSFSKVNSADDIYNYASGEVESEITEYFAHDAENVYYAVEFKQTNDNRAFQWQFKPFNSFDIFNGDADLTTYYYTRVSWQARYQTNWHHPLHENTDYSGSWAPSINGNCVRTPVIFTALDTEQLIAGTVSEELECASGKNAETNVKVYEVRLAKSYIAEVSGCEVADVRVVPYFTYFHSAAGLGHVYTEDDIAALTAAGAAFLPENGAGELGYNYIVLDNPPPAEMNLEDLLGATYVGAALGADDAKPVLDGVVNDGEYQAEFVVATDGGENTSRRGYHADLRGEYKEYVSHDADYIYFAAEFTNCTTDLRGRFYWNLSFINSFDFIYNGGASANAAFTQGENGIKSGWLYGAEVKADLAEGYSERSNAVTVGTAPVKDTDFFVAVGRGEPAETEWTGYYDVPQTYEFKVSKAWYAAQAGLESAADVRELAWITMGQYINGGASAYTQIGHYLADDDLAALEAAYGLAYTANASNADLDDDRLLPHLFVLDEATIEDMPGYEALSLETPVETAPVQDGTIGDGEYTYSRVLTPYTPNKGNVEDVIDSYSNPTTEYWAFDDEFIYYAYTNQLIYSAGSQFKIRLEPDYTVADIVTPFQAHRQLEDAEAIQLTVGAEAANSASEIPEGKAAPTAEEFVSYHVWGGTAYSPAVTEIKISRAYLEAQMGLESGDAIKFAYSTYGSDTKWDGEDWTYLHLDHVLTEDQKAWLKLQGVTTPLGTSTNADMISRICNMVIIPAVEVSAPTIDSLDDLYAPTYVGAPLAPDAAKPVVDSYVRAGEYQVAYVVSAENSGNVARQGVPANLLDDFTTYVAHDADWVYVAFEFYNGSTDGRGRLYWNLSFIDSFNITYGGGSDINTAFLNNGYGIVDGWNFGAEVKADLSEGFSGRNNAVTRGTAPVQGEDFDVAIWKEDLTGVSATTRQVYEFKFSKAWYAAQVGLESAADVRELAWTNQGQYINEYASSYSQIGHYLTADDLAALAAAGFNYTIPGTASHPYDNSMLPLLFVLDVDPEGGDATMVPAEDVNRPAEPVDPPASSETPSTETPSTQPSTQPATTAPATTTAAATTTAKATTKAATTAAATTAAATEEAKGCKGSIAISALVLLPTLAGGALLIKRRKED